MRFESIFDVCVVQDGNLPMNGMRELDVEKVDVMGEMEAAETIQHSEERVMQQKSAVRYCACRA